MKLANIILLMAGGAFWQIQASAETLDVQYSRFYSHVKKLDNPQTNALRFAFGFQHIAHNRLCHISRAQIVTPKQTLILTVENNNRFTVPTDKILKMARAKVVIELDDQANQCDMSVQLETLPSYLKTQYSHDELLVLFNQYQAFFDEMGGFLSFMMPSAEGLLFHFGADLSFPKKLRALLDENGAIFLSKTWIMENKNVDLPYKPLRITAFVEK
jgi:hypothetical protein